MSKRIQDLKSPMTRWSEAVFAAAAKPFYSLSDDQRFWLGFAALCLLTTLLINNPLWRASGEQVYKEGDIVRERINSPSDVYFFDTDETEKLKADAKNAVKPIFRYESNKSDRAVQTFLSSWEKLQRRGSSGEASNSKPSNSTVKAETFWTGAGGVDVGKVFAGRTFSRNELEAVQSALRESSEGYIYDDVDRQYFQNEVVVFDRSKPNLQSRVSMPESNWILLSTAREKLQTRLAAIKSLSPKEVDAFYTATEILVEPSISYDSVATEAAMTTASDNVQPRTITLMRGQIIASDGDVVTPDMLSKIAAIRDYSSSSRQLNRFFGLLVFITSLFWVAWKFIENRGILPRLALSAEKTFALFGFIVLLQTAVMAVCFKLADFTAIQNVKAPLNDPMLWAFAIPFATGSLLMTLLADRPTALFTGLFTSFLAGFLAPRGLEFTIFAALASAVAVYGIGPYRSRQTVTIAGALVGAGSVILALAMLAYTQQPFILNTILLAIACGLASGIFTAALTSMLLPICETSFGILTDVKLLELSNADLPVLGQLAMRAPGTNQHSHAVGQLAEEACRVVGGNGLLTRIGALYHDIGKTAAPEHFVENQLAKNPHDKLKPTQSAKIIISHVTYGTKLAKEMGLPQRIIDFIPQHHGTRTLHYFLKRAQDEARDGSEISENDFRYPGPKPQFKEAAIMMIADSCEAAARSLAEPNPENIRFIVTKIIDAILADDQLGECDLTLRELTQIRESMIKSLVAIYHSRVDYPGYVPPNTGQFKISGEIKMAEPSVTEAKYKYSNPADIPISKGGEIEDEAIDRSHQPDKADAKRAE
ncbi:MAG: HDIG domain-containing protein [Chloracidobacterium sp.]|nr:HDIG domain-containing protein [Chloracidobacterium sp.]